MVRQSTGVLDRCRQATSRTQCRPRSEFRSGAAAREDAEFVPLRVGKYDPTLVALADVGVPSTEIEQATDLFILVSVGWIDVEVQPVLDGLGLGDARMSTSVAPGQHGPCPPTPKVRQW